MLAAPFLQLLRVFVSLEKQVEGFSFLFFSTGKHYDLINLHPESCGQQLIFCRITPPATFSSPPPHSTLPLHSQLHLLSLTLSARLLQTPTLLVPLPLGPSALPLTLM